MPSPDFDSERSSGQRRRTARALKLPNVALYKCVLPVGAELAADVVLEHYGLATAFHPNVTIGRRVNIYHHVTLATETCIGSPSRTKC